jgi:hypothetical protein
MEGNYSSMISLHYMDLCIVPYVKMYRRVMSLNVRKEGSRTV